MWTFIKIFGTFWIIWILWYITGGPLRDDASQKYVGLNKEGTLQTSGSTTPYRR